MCLLYAMALHIPTVYKRGKKESYLCFCVCWRDVNRLDINKGVKKPGMVACACISSTWKVDTKDDHKKIKGSLI